MSKYNDNYTSIPSMPMALVPCCLEKRNVFMLINPNTYIIFIKESEWVQRQLYSPY